MVVTTPNKGRQVDLKRITAPMVTFSTSKPIDRCVQRHPEASVMKMCLRKCGVYNPRIRGISQLGDEGGHDRPGNLKDDARPVIRALGDALAQSVTPLVVQAQDGLVGWLGGRLGSCLRHAVSRTASARSEAALPAVARGVRPPTSSVTQAWLRLNQAPGAIKDGQPLIFLSERVMRLP